MKKKLCSILLVCAMLLTLAACGSKGTPVLHYDLPEGFTEQSDGMYYAPDFPNDTANINIMESQEDQVTFSYTKTASARR